jgi:hypothetical protein
MRTRRAANLPNSGEIEPTNKLPPTSMEVRLVSVERVEETEPVKRLLFRFKDDSLVSPPRKEGIGPTREFPPRLRALRPVRAERVVGRLPVKRLL